MYIHGKKLQRDISLDPTNFGVTGARNLVPGTACANTTRAAALLRLEAQPVYTLKHTDQPPIMLCKSEALHVPIHTAASMLRMRPQGGWRHNVSALTWSVGMSSTGGCPAPRPLCTDSCRRYISSTGRPAAIQPAFVIQYGYRVTLDCRKRYDHSKAHTEYRVGGAALSVVSSVLTRGSCCRQCHIYEPWYRWGPWGPWGERLTVHSI